MKKRIALIFLLAGIHCGRSVGEVLYYHSDHTQSLGVVSSSEGEILQKDIYSPFGEVLQVSSLGKGFFASRFETYPMDREANLFYGEARYYDPTLAQYLSPDPLKSLQNPSDLHLYAYAWSNPLKQIDPSGREEEGVEEKKNGIVSATSLYLQSRPGDSSQALEQIKSGVRAAIDSLDTDALKEGLGAIQAISNTDQQSQALKAYHQGLDDGIGSLKSRLGEESKRAERISFGNMVRLTAKVSLGGGTLAGIFKILSRLDDSSSTGVRMTLPVLGGEFLEGFVLGGSVVSLVGIGAYWAYYGEDYWRMYQLVELARAIPPLWRETAPKQNTHLEESPH